MAKTAPNIVPPIQFVFLMWVAFSIQVITDSGLGFLGIFPREWFGLIGILTAPLIHGSFGHILSNSVPLLVLGFMLFYFYQRIAYFVFIQCYFVTGILVWIFARPFYHIGASGLVYGLAVFLIMMGLLVRNLRSILISTFVLILYGSLLYNSAAYKETVSFESHGLGAAVGFACAMGYSRLYAKKKKAG